MIKEITESWGLFTYCSMCFPFVCLFFHCLIKILQNFSDLMYVYRWKHWPLQANNYQWRGNYVKIVWLNQQKSCTFSLSSIVVCPSISACERTSKATCKPHARCKLWLATFLLSTSYQPCLLRMHLGINRTCN